MELMAYAAQPGAGASTQYGDHAGTPTMDRKYR